ncbi:MAG: hypothetical protein RL141_633 [Candidatus Parcubacteria bacterium]
MLMPWGRFADPDAFYHAHISWLLWTRGPLEAFPWLDLTTLGTAFADQHFLYHVLLAPLARVVAWVAPGPFAELWATQFLAVGLATATALVAWMALKRIDPPRAWLWTAFLLIVSGFTGRMLLGKASPLAVAAFIGVIASVVGDDGHRFKQNSRTYAHRAAAELAPLRGAQTVLTARWAYVRLFCLNLLRGLPYAIFLFGFLFALSHGGWIIALLAAGLMLSTDIILNRVGHSLSWRRAVTRAPWRSSLGLLAGIGVGLCLHPNRDVLFSFLWTQVITAGIAPPSGLVQGMEWRPASVSSLIATLAPLLLALLAGAMGMLATLMRKPRQVMVDDLRRLILLLMPVALTLALTFKSRRFVEYLAPALALAVAALWRMVDWPVFRAELRTVTDAWPRILRRAALPVALIVAVVIPVRHTWQTWMALRRNGDAYAFNTYRTTFAAISARAKPGDRVFHTSWDEFPLLFAADDRLRYISGLDPAFLHDANPGLSRAVRDLTLGIATSTAWQVIVEQTGSQYVFTTPKRHPAFDAAIAADPRFHELARDMNTAAYEIIKP